MATAATMLEDFDIEIANTRRTIERLPADKADWKPHARSMPLGKLAMHCATMPAFGLYIMEDEGMDLAKTTRPHMSLVLVSVEECLRQLDERATACRAAIAAASDEHLATLWRFSFGEHLISEYTRSLSFRVMCFNHLVHHTAQLGVYLRLNEVPVPALYGPSADEQWSPPK